MVNFPAVTAPGVAEVLAHDSPAPGIHAQVRVSSEAARLLPNGFDSFGTEPPSMRISVWLSFHAGSRTSDFCRSAVSALFPESALSASARSFGAAVFVHARPRGRLQTPTD